MSFFDYDRDNKINLRLDKLKINDVYQLNRDTNEYERIGNGGGPDPITELPYYLKSNSIKIDNETISNTVLDSNSVDVVDQVNNKSSSLLADKLILGDNTGNSVLDKESIDLLTELNTGMTVSVPTNTNLKSAFPIVYDSVSKKFIKSTGFRIGQNENSTYFGSNGTGSFGRSTDQVLVSPGTVSILYNNNIWTDIAQGFARIRSKIEPAPVVYFDTTKFRLGHTVATNNSTFDTTKDHINITKNDISLYNAALATTSTLDINSFLTLNKLKNRSQITPVSSTRLITHDTSTGNIDYIPIPTTVTLPGYLGENSILINAYDNQQTISMIPLDGQQSRISVSNKGGSGPQYTALTVDGLKYHPVGPTTTNDLTFDYADVSWVKNQQTIVNDNVRKVTVTSHSLFTRLNKVDSSIGSNGIPLKTINMQNNDELILDFRGGNYFAYKEWIVFRVTNAGVNSYIVDAKIELCTNYNDNVDPGTTEFKYPQLIIHRMKTDLPLTGTTVTTGSLALLIRNSDTSMGSGHYFQGIIRIKMINRDISSLPEAVIT